MYLIVFLQFLKSRQSYIIAASTFVYVRLQYFAVKVDLFKGYSVDVTDVNYHKSGLIELVHET